MVICFCNICDGFWNSWKQCFLMFFFILMFSLRDLLALIQEEVHGHLALNVKPYTSRIGALFNFFIIYSDFVLSAETIQSIRKLKVLTTDLSSIYHLSNKSPNILQFQLLNCEDLLLFTVLYHCQLNLLGFLTVGQNHSFIDITRGFRNFLWAFFIIVEFYIQEFILFRK